MVNDREIVQLLREISRKVTTSESIIPEEFELFQRSLDVPIVLPTGRFKTLFEERREGYFVMLHIQTNRPDVKFNLYIDDFVIKTTPEELYEFGLIGYNPRTFWLSKYDTVDNVFHVWFTPMPYQHFFTRNKFEVYASSSQTAVKYEVVKFLRRG